MKRRKGKCVRRLAAVLMCMVMILAGSVTAFAEEEVPEQETAGEQETTDIANEEVKEEETVQTEQAPVNRSARAVNELQDGVNVIREGADGQTFDIDEGKCVMLAGTTSADPIIFKNCTFNLSGSTMKISGNQGVNYHNGEVITKLWIGDNVQFDQCKFLTNGGKKSSSAGYDACIYFFDGNIVLNDCTLKAENYQGQFLGLYGSTGSVTFNRSDICTVGNIGGWSYAMYAHAVMNLKDSTMTATGMKRAADGKNINAFYSGDMRTGYDAINVEDSKIEFRDNQAGGFAINNINIHVKNSEIQVIDNLGNACNSGYWIVENSEITMNGNRGGHALSCIGTEMKDSKLEILHNGYAGLYIQTKDSVFTNSTIDIRCNGEKLASYSAGDVWLNGHKASFENCSHVWLGGVGRKGSVVNTNCKYFVAYDLFECKFKGNTEEILGGVKLAEQDKHALFLNSKVDFDYARSDISDNSDRDLFQDLTKETATGKDTAKIGKLTTAQLSHHKYDWENGEVTDKASEDFYGVVKYACVDSCKDYESRTGEHTYSFDCQGTYVYAPLVGLSFEGNAENVANIPEPQAEIDYEGKGTEPEEPTRDGYVFTGWYTDKECTKEFDFQSALTKNWTIVYAGWEKALEEITEPGENPTKPEKITESVDNKKADKKAKETVKTGDTNNFIFVFILAATAACVIAICVRKKCRR